ncbi:unnamed protein product [Protopolystoma xenopodis]|uniref:Uncharacterized protein n=1 Tax=Protopolystoma xenopodis TaxID=117903 RepID=A0A448XDD2_9PLAT|nr:unnamed protein product [Protopolystoma xenopodis]
MRVHFGLNHKAVPSQIQLTTSCAAWQRDSGWPKRKGDLRPCGPKPTNTRQLQVRQGLVSPVGSSGNHTLHVSRSNKQSTMSISLKVKSTA